MANPRHNNLPIHQYTFSHSDKKEIQNELRKQEEFNRIVNLSENVIDEEIKDDFLDDNLYHISKNFVEYNIKENLSSALTEINFRDFTRLDTNVYSKIGFYAKNLEKVDFSNQLITDNVLDHITATLKKLTGLRINNCRELSNAGVQRTLNELGDRLTDFGCAFNSSIINSDCLKGLNVSIIEILDIEECNGIGKSFFNKFVKEKHLSLVELNFSFITSNLDSRVIGSIFTKCQKSLKSVILKGSLLSNISPEHFQTFGELSKLKYLDLSFSNITNSVLSKISFTWYDLEILRVKSLSDINDITLENMIKESPRIRLIETSNNNSLTNGFLFHLSKNTIDHKLLIIINHTPGISDNVIGAVYKENENLRIIRSNNTFANPGDSNLRIPLLPLNTKFAQIPPFRKKN